MFEVNRATVEASLQFDDKNQKSWYIFAQSSSYPFFLLNCANTQIINFMNVTFIHKKTRKY